MAAEVFHELEDLRVREAMQAEKQGHIVEGTVRIALLDGPLGGLQGACDVCVAKSNAMYAVITVQEITLSSFHLAAHT